MLEVLVKGSEDDHDVEIVVGSRVVGRDPSSSRLRWDLFSLVCSSNERSRVVLCAGLGSKGLRRDGDGSRRGGDGECRVGD